MAWPTTNDPKTEFVTLRMTKGESDDLDAYAQSRNMKRSVAVRDAVSRVIAAEQKRAKRSRPSTSKPGGRIDEGEHDE